MFIFTGIASVVARQVILIALNKKKYMLSYDESGQNF